MGELVAPWLIESDGRPLGRNRDRSLQFSRSRPEEPHCICGAAKQLAIQEEFGAVGVVPDFGDAHRCDSQLPKQIFYPVPSGILM